MTSQNQLAEKVVKKIQDECNKNLCQELTIELEDVHFVGKNSIAFDIRTKAINEPEINYSEDNERLVKKFIISIFEIFERVRVSQDWDVDDFQTFYKYHISCGIIKMNYREILEE